MPIVTMVSYAIVYRHGLEAYVCDAKAAGVAGAIVPDLPVDESDALAEICRREDFSLIQLVTPTTPRDRAVRIAENVDRIPLLRLGDRHHGRADRVAAGLFDNVRWLREPDGLADLHRLRDQPSGARPTLAPVADGLIVGSAMVRRISAADEQPRAEVLADLAAFAEELLEAAQSHHHWSSATPSTSSWLRSCRNSPSSSIST